MAISALPAPYTPKTACLNFGMWGHVRIYYCQISVRSVQGFWSLRRPEIAVTHSLELNQVKSSQSLIRMSIANVYKSKNRHRIKINKTMIVTNTVINYKLTSQESVALIFGHR